MAMAAAWDPVHPRLTHWSAWLDHHGPLPVIEGTLIRRALTGFCPQSAPRMITRGRLGARSRDHR
jgi:hypothetical protein